MKPNKQLRNPRPQFNTKLNLDLRERIRFEAIRQGLTMNAIICQCLDKQLPKFTLTAEPK
jgi:hypothetical protein